MSRRRRRQKSSHFNRERSQRIHSRDTERRNSLLSDYERLPGHSILPDEVRRWSNENRDRIRKSVYVKHALRENLRLAALRSLTSRNQVVHNAFPETQKRVEDQLRAVYVEKVCQARKDRREALFRLRITGKGRGGPKNRRMTVDSQVKCK